MRGRHIVAAACLATILITGLSPPVLAVRITDPGGLDAPPPWYVLYDQTGTQARNTGAADWFSSRTDPINGDNRLDKPPTGCTFSKIAIYVSPGGGSGTPTDLTLSLYRTVEGTSAADTWAKTILPANLIASKNFGNGQPAAGWLVLDFPTNPQPWPASSPTDSGYVWRLTWTGSANITFAKWNRPGNQSTTIVGNTQFDGGAFPGQENRAFVTAVYVPEPTALVLLGLAGCMAIRRRR
jgi:hypothetical protein